MKNVHVCLVSEQPNPNLVPLIDESMTVDHVILCHTKRTLPQSQWLQSALKDFQVSSELLLLKAVNDFSILREQFQELCSELLAPGDVKLLFNVTGGTKPMSLALFEVAYLTEMDNSEAYYSDLKNQIFWLLPSDRASVQLQDRIKLTQFLKVRGFELVVQQAVDLRSTKTLAQWIAANVNRLTGALTQLNFLAATAKKNLRSETIRGGGTLDELIDELAECGLLKRHQGSLVFESEKARFFCNGGLVRRVCL